MAPPAATVIDSVSFDGDEVKFHSGSVGFSSDVVVIE